jgi:hypothetical protein
VSPLVFDPIFSLITYHRLLPTLGFCPAASGDDVIIEKQGTPTKSTPRKIHQFKMKNESLTLIFLFNVASCVPRVSPLNKKIREPRLSFYNVTNLVAPVLKIMKIFFAALKPQKKASLCEVATKMLENAL